MLIEVLHNRICILIQWQISVMRETWVIMGNVKMGEVATTFNVQRCSNRMTEALGVYVHQDGLVIRVRIREVIIFRLLYNID